MAEPSEGAAGAAVDEQRRRFRRGDRRAPQTKATFAAERRPPQISQRWLVVCKKEHTCRCDGMVDVVDSKSTAGDSVPVRVRPPAPINPIVNVSFTIGFIGAGDRTRTGTLSPAVDFESTTSTIPSHRQVLWYYTLSFSKWQVKYYASSPKPCSSSISSTVCPRWVRAMVPWQGNPA